MSKTTDRAFPGEGANDDNPVTSGAGTTGDMCPDPRDAISPGAPRGAEVEYPALSHGKFGTRKEIKDMHRKARNISRFLKIIGNDVRLLALCHLMQHKELTVGELMTKIPPTSQSSLSQHLGKMRELGLITYRRDSQTLHYRIRDPKVITVLTTLKKVFCDDEDDESDSA